MSVSSVQHQSQAPALQLQAAAPKKVDRPNDGDADDGVKAAPPAQSVNTSGQKVGQLINVTA